MADNKRKLGGWRLEPKDERDLPVEKLLQSGAVSGSADVVDLRPLCSAVEDQGQAGSCVANATVGALEMLENSRGDQFVDLSRMFVYYNARAAQGETDKDEGSFVRDAFMSLSVLGTCPEADWPYEMQRLYTRPSWSCYRTAYAHRVDKFYKIFSTGEQRLSDIEAALKAMHPVVFGAQVFPAFEQCTGEVAMPAGDSLGGHAMCIVGFDRPNHKLIVRNSWGTGWGDKGYCYVPYAYLDAAGADDLWVPT